MAELNLSRATTVGLTDIPDFIVESMALDVANADGSETFVYFDKVQENYGYYFNHPQVASPINALCTWAFGQGYTTPDPEMAVILPKIDGNGKETFGSIVWNQEAVMLMNGDSFTEIILSDINFSPLVVCFCII